ncbi:MAG: hypothetical protein ACTSU4_02795 [Promethearchaeota archaeon]
MKDSKDLLIQFLLYFLMNKNSNSQKEEQKEMESMEMQDDDWARDWSTIVEIFRLIDELKEQFDRLEVSYLRELQQKILILNLEKYTWSLQNYILEKYSKG